MKILLVGSNFSYAIERFYVKYLTALGVDINHYPAPDIVFNYHSRNIFNKILFKTKINTGYKPVNVELVRIAESYQPDVIWIFKGMEIYPDTLKLLRQKKFRLANYNPDHPFIITSVGSGNKNVTNSVGLFDLHFCYHNSLRTEIEQKFHIPTVFLPFAYETSDLVYTDPAAVQEINRVCFQGNPDRYRAGIIELLSKNGFGVDVYGIGWQKMGVTSLPGVSVYGIASRAEFWRKNQEYRLQLNLFRFYNVGSHNMRTFEIPAVGGIELTTYSDEQASFFDEGKEIFFFRNNEGLIEQVRRILEMPAEQVAAVRAAARKRSLESGYTFADRANTVFNTFKKMIADN